MIESRREIARILTENEKGEEVTVVEWMTFYTFQNPDGTSSTRKGQRDWTLLDGSGVNYVDEVTFKVVQTDEILRKFR